MGKTQGMDWITTQDHVLDVFLDFIDHVIPGHRFAVAGTSYGGLLTRRIVYRRSTLIDGLLLLVPSILPRDKRILPPHVTLVKDSMVLAELEPDEEKLFQSFAVVQSRELLYGLRGDIFPAIKAADHEFLTKLSENREFSFDVDALPEPFAAPTLMLMGRQDSSVGYRDAWNVLEQYPRASFAVLDRAGHGLAVEQSGLFNALVNEWIDRVEEHAKVAD